MLDATSSPLRARKRLAFDAARLADWVRFDRRSFGLALILALAGAVINVSGSLRLLGTRSLLEIAEFIGFLFIDCLVISVPLVAALHALERLPLRGWRRHMTTVAAGALVTGLAGGLFYNLLRPQKLVADELFGSHGLGFLLFAMWMGAALALIARAWLVESREASHASKLLARIRSEQMSVRRRLVEGRLKAIQARVDPLFFFAMLEAVQKTYTVDASCAERLLDELTVFLRAALPRLRTASSTVGQECELASSFARLQVLAGLGAARLEVGLEPSIVSASFPPGVLLPLIDELLRETADAGDVGISFSAAPTPALERNGSVRSTVIMQLTTQVKPSVEALARTQATLLDLFGATAHLISIAVGGGALTTVQVPYELAEA